MQRDDRPSPLGPAFDSALRELPPEQQLWTLLEDIEHPARHYPAWLARGIKANLRRLDRLTRRRLLWKLRGCRRGPWKQLKRRVAAMECQRRGRDYAWPWDTGA